MTDTTGMRNACGKLGGSVVALAIVFAVMAGGAVAGGRCRDCAGCRDAAGGSPYGTTGCGPRVYGPCHEPVGPRDQCDACGRFAGCEGYRQLPDMLAPWQLPPGRGFRPPEAFGYLSGPCSECATCGPRQPWSWGR